MEFNQQKYDAYQSLMDRVMRSPGAQFNFTQYGLNPDDMQFYAQYNRQQQPVQPQPLQQQPVQSQPMPGSPVRNMMTNMFAPNQNLQPQPLEIPNAGSNQFGLGMNNPQFGGASDARNPNAGGMNNPNFMGGGWGQQGNKWNRWKNRQGTGGY